MRIIVSFKASNAKFIGAEAADGKLVANMSRDFPFLLEELGNNKVRLRALPNQGRYVEAAGGGGQGLFARLETPDGNCTFSLVQVTAKEVALLSPNGVNYVTCEDNGEITARATVRGPRETFAMTKFIAKEKKSSKATDDSSQDGIQALLWNDMTHAQVVDTALRLMFKNHLDKPPVRLLSVLTARKPFKDAMLKGLKDADYELQYTGIAWKYHFYHPGSGQNYMGFGETAKSMGVRYFDLALNAGNDIYRKLQRGQQPTDQELFGCGYNLGVALHYITDLTQPMHASNFANVFGDDFPWPKANEFRHKGLEEMTEDIVVKQNYLGNAPDIAYWQFTPEPYANAGDILHEAAVIANATFLRTVKPLMPEPGAAWKETDVKRILDETIKTVGLHSVARFLSFWAMHVSRVELVKPATLYRIKGYQGKYITKEDHWLKMADGGRGANQEFFFLSNGDGTHRIVCNAARGRRWTMQTRDWNLCIPSLELPDGDLKFSKFKLVSHGYRIKIHEFTANEIISVKTNWPWTGHLVRWTDDEAEMNYFELEEVGPMGLDGEEMPTALETTSGLVADSQGKTLNFHFTINM